MQVTVVAKNTCPKIGEGPHWIEATKQLAYVDVYGHQLHLLDTATGKDSFIQLDEEVHYIIPKNSGDFIVSKGHYICSLEWNSQKNTPIVAIENGTENYINDGKCDALGRLWTGTMSPQTTHEGEQFVPQKASMYSYDPKQGLKRHMSEITVSNGFGWTADNSIMFFVDSIPGTVYAFDFNLQEGTIANKRVVHDFKANCYLGIPDGLCVDINDNLWVAGYSSGKVHNIDSKTGKVLRSVELPATKLTSCCFGGPNYTELFVTSRNVNSETKKQPLSGSVFKVTGLGVQGIPAHNYCG